MRLNALIPIVCGFFISCNNSNTNRSFVDTVSISQHVDTIKQNPKRQLMIKELLKLKAVFSSKDKDTISQLFTFPLADTTLDLYIDDSTYLNDFKKNGDKTTKALFIKYFPQVYHNMQLDQLTQLFEYINIERLNQKDSLEHEVRNKKEPCYKFYHIYINQEIVTLEFGTNTNENYVANRKKTENDESFGDECEFVSIWTFRFDGQKLNFVRQMTAG